MSSSRARPSSSSQTRNALPVLLAGIVHGADVRVRDQRSDVGLPPESLERVGPVHFLGPEDLDRDVAFEPEIAGAIDFGRAVTAD